MSHDSYDPLGRTTGDARGLHVPDTGEADAFVLTPAIDRYPPLIDREPPEESEPKDETRRHPPNDQPDHEQPWWKLHRIVGRDIPEEEDRTEKDHKGGGDRLQLPRYAKDAELARCFRHPF